MACTKLQLCGPGSEQRQGGERTGMQSGAAATCPKRPSTALAVTQSSIAHFSSWYRGQCCSKARASTRRVSEAGAQTGSRKRVSVRPSMSSRHSTLQQSSPKCSRAAPPLGSKGRFQWAHQARSRPAKATGTKNQSPAPRIARGRPERKRSNIFWPPLPLEAPPRSDYE